MRSALAPGARLNTSDDGEIVQPEDVNDANLKLEAVQLDLTSLLVIETV